ncbi:Acetylcholinesterase precursor, putative [Perkinsus marinus ATCC 50983]|uniref:Carboxylic ester hydrolase n=1 Tax=Perkinsus marinus (strain ATCC 50983 / TXsc) TaxID=423536 RepID=C5LXL3_PERM5|nr:Acetylcholinesterase precursor, putative [Perkinsus marinus ATCC 50983]EEQ98535.1 Acetylcholinesterase precursor, putative [Perkinsus marinus ATCC 50983]|eukprot:XP_002765818.1 Acetylcholinesterase precursor, putative [Perkinsus marinus ATCC 50983]
MSGCSESEDSETVTTVQPSGEETTQAPQSTSSPTSAIPNSGDVITQNGPIIGTVIYSDMEKQQPIRQDVEVFYGIPFAEPPVGDLRFKAPREFRETWEEPINMTTKKSMCVQSNGRGDEDCLYLNVYRPANVTQSSRLPVMAWIYGGGYVNGNSLSYDGTVLAAEHNSIVVTMNYRLGPLGFLGSSASFEEEGTTGNWGQLDQQQGLRWIQKNIAAFGGDEDRVMIFGESAGAFSVMWHLAAPGSAGLFHAAILESGTSHTGAFFQHTEDAYKYYDWLAQEVLGCKDGNDMECLRAADATKFTLPEGIRFDPAAAPEWASPIFPVMPVGPVIDGVALPDVPLEVVRAGKHNKVPTIAGVNHDEGTGFVLTLKALVPNVPLLPTEESVEDTIYYVLQDENAVQEAMGLYHPDNFALLYGEENLGFELASQMIRDAIFHCPTMALAKALSDQGGDSYVYGFDMNPLFPKRVGNINTGNIPGMSFGNFSVTQIGTFHSAEIPFVFKSFTDKPVSVKNPDMYDLYMGHPPRSRGDAYHNVSDQFSCMWANMAESASPVDGDAVCPAEPSLTRWGKYMESDESPLGQYLHIGKDSIEMRKIREDNQYPDSEFPSTEICAFWDTHPIVFHNLRSDLTTTSTFVQV